MEWRTLRWIMLAIAYVLFIMLVLTVVTMPAPGRAEEYPTASADPSPDLMWALMAWAEPRLGLPVPDVLPRIVRRSHCEINAIVRPDADCPQDTRGTVFTRAIYQGNVLWLNNEWRSDSLRDVSYLLHELVHHMQFHAGVQPIPCAAEALEKPAYDVHFAFLEAAGVDPHKISDINGLYLALITNCWDQR